MTSTACSKSADSSSRSNQHATSDAPPEQSNQNDDSDRIPEYVGGAELQTISEPAYDPVRSPPPSSPTGESCWIWDVPCLPKVPAHVPLERASLRLCMEQHSTITKRISDFMRLNSITCTYHTKEARVDCMTECCLKFVVQLWRDNKDVIVEMQRRRGCSVVMQIVRRCLYKSITGEVQVHIACPDVQRRRPSPILEKRMFEELKQQEMIPSKLRDARRQCLDLLESQKKDENRLGMESLLVLSDRMKTNEIEAEEVARALIYDEGELSHRLRNAYLAFIQRRWDEGDWLDADCGITDEASCLEFSSERSELFHGHLLALKVLVNCLDLMACYEHDYLANDAIMIHLCSPFWTEILNVLVINLQESCQRPQEAALSTKCIRILECLGPDSVTPFVESVIAPLLSSAYEFGKAHHLALQTESAQLLHAIEASH